MSLDKFEEAKADFDKVIAMDATIMTDVEI